jgi:ABC-type uncharacterized transport system ATPase subunit
MRVLYGLIAPDAGHIEIEGRAARIQHPADAMRLGLGMVHQHFMLVDTLTVAENVTLGREPRRPLGGYDRARVTVVRAGRVVGGGTADSLSTERIAQLMVGRPVTTALARGASAPGAAALEARPAVIGRAP